MTNNVFHVAAKALILNKNKQILVLRKNPKRITVNPDHWDLPGGRIKGDQDLEEALMMEIEEELKIDPSQIEIGELFDSSLSKLKIHEGNDSFGLVIFTYLCQLKSTNEDFVLNEEHSEYLWADIKKAAELLSTKFSNKFITKLKYL